MKHFPLIFCVKNRSNSVQNVRSDFCFEEPSDLEFQLLDEQRNVLGNFTCSIYQILMTNNVNFTFNNKIAMSIIISR